jgi:hypothetical protein
MRTIAKVIAVGIATGLCVHGTISGQHRPDTLDAVGTLLVTYHRSWRAFYFTDDAARNQTRWRRRPPRRQVSNKSPIERRRALRLTIKHGHQAMHTLEARTSPAERKDARIISPRFWSVASHGAISPAADAP